MRSSSSTRGGKPPWPAPVPWRRTMSALNLTQKAGNLRAFYVSDCPDDFSHVARIFLGREVEDDVERVDIDSLLK